MYFMIDYSLASILFHTVSNGKCVLYICVLLHMYITEYQYISKINMSDLYYIAAHRTKDFFSHFTLFYIYICMHVCGC